MSEVIVLENDKIIIKVLTLGAILNSFYVKSLDTDIVLGFDDYSTYLGKNSYSIGKSIGRCANRIGNSKFSLNGIEYHLLANNGPNSLHGGEVNFGNVEWKIENKTENKVVLSYDSKDMEAGYPGNLHVEAIYELKDTELKLTYTGISDKDTIFNMTNHSYFNLDKVKTDILSHSLLINADKVNLNDENGMASDKVIEVKNTPFDFLDYKLIGDAVSANGVLLNQYCNGIIDGIVKTDGSDKRLIDNLDTNYLYENLNEKIICILKNDKLKLNIISDLPCVQIYTGKVIDVDGREGHYGGYAGVAIEPQFCPNAINYENFLKPIIKANEKVSHVIKYRIAKSDTV
ncbi:MAG: galactose mutarotase [Lachnospiraceae bacterium]|nr:galactose mutarotase [Lachnospiraceae bacterium]